MTNPATGTSGNSTGTAAGSFFTRTIAVAISVAAFLAILAVAHAWLKKQSGRWSSSHRVIVVWPESWASGDYRKCLLQNFPGQKWPQLDCDLPTETHWLTHDTPASRMLTLDVRFDGDNYGQTNVNWTCLKRNGELTCKN